MRLIDAALDLPATSRRLQRYCLSGTLGDCFLDLRRVLRRDVLRQQIQVTPVVDVEHGGGQCHANGVALAQVEVDVDLVGQFLLTFKW